MESFKIILLSMGAAISYGILHDQITARICVEYFTIGHPPIFGTDSPTLLAFGWGIVATWWVGLLMGVPLAIMAQVGSMPRLTAAHLFKPIVILMLCCASLAATAGIIGFLLARSGRVWLLEPLASRVPLHQHVPFLVDLWIHNASYLASFLGGLVLICWTWQRRYQLMRQSQASKAVT